VNLDYLKTFMEVARLGNFSEVARRLSITQPAVSFQIQRLERDLGVRLLERGPKSVTLTEAGERLLGFAEKVERQRQGLLDDLDRMREELTGKIVVAASTIPGEVLLPPVLGEFKALHPAVDARMDICDSLAVISKVQEGTHDVGFCGLLPDVRDLDSFEVADDEIVLIVFPDHPFAGRKSVSFPELQGEPFVVREDSSGTQSSLRSLLANSGLDTAVWAPALVLGSTQAVLSAVEAGVGIAFISHLAIKKSVALGLVKQVPVKGLKLRRAFHCIYRKERANSRLPGEFISFVQARQSQR
jgi:DNA-binding transcriptional LysR family regulator